MVQKVGWGVANQRAHQRGSRIGKAHANTQKECVKHSRNQKKHNVAGNQAGKREGWKPKWACA